MRASSIFLTPILKFQFDSETVYGGMKSHYVDATVFGILVLLFLFILFLILFLLNLRIKRATESTKKPTSYELNVSVKIFEG